MSENQLWVFAGRWTIQNIDGTEAECRAKLCAKLKMYCANFIFQLEDTTDNLHYQIYMKVREKIRAKKLAIDWNEDLKGIEIRPCSGAGKQALSKYCMKDESRVAGPWADKPIYMGTDLPTTLWSWQRKLEEYLLGPVNPREVIVIVDERGDGGKSAFRKYMYFHHKILGVTFGKASDLLNLVFKMPPTGAYIFNLTRSQPKDASINDIWSTIEDIKDGYVVNTKYETGVMTMDPPHVVVMCNFHPKLEGMSADRWNIVNLGDCEELNSERRTRPKFSRFQI